MEKTLAFALLSETLCIASIVAIMFGLGLRRFRAERHFWVTVFAGGIVVGNAVALMAVYGFRPPLVLLVATVGSAVLSAWIAALGMMVGGGGQLVTARESRPIYLALWPTAIPSLSALGLWWIAQ